MTRSISILWADDEIDLLRPHILFLGEKGYNVHTSNNGEDAIDAVKSSDFDIIFLDENMPGLSGLEVLEKIKTMQPHIPVVMITKNEEESIMDEALGGKIADYLIKPVNPKQILLTIKKNVDTKRLISEKTTSKYQTEFSQIGMRINERLDWDSWTEIYKKLVYWELELQGADEDAMDEVFKMQKRDANINFARYVRSVYMSWFNESSENQPLLSKDIFKHKVFPDISKNRPTVVIIVDNLRYDQWKTMEGSLQEYYAIDEDLYCSILPTATQYARNAMFAGMMPLEISRKYPDLWIEDYDEQGKNLSEERFLKDQVNRNNLDIRLLYDKINSSKDGVKYVENPNMLLENELSVLVYNFVDMLSHSKTEMKMIRELASDEAAYRSLTLSWFQHSPLMDLFKELASHKIRIVLTTDHGTIRVQDPVKVIGDRFTTTNLRYKQGRNLNYNPKDVFEITHPEKANLPKPNVSTRYIFAQGEDFFAYPNNYNHYVKYYRDTFQHGGVSLEEMIIPLISMTPKS